LVLKEKGKKATNWGRTGGVGGKKRGGGWGGGGGGASVREMINADAVDSKS